jgi:hypothetical protein
MSHALHAPNMYMYMWTVVWRLTPVLLRLFTICKLSIKFTETDYLEITLTPTVHISHCQHVL